MYNVKWIQDGKEMNKSFENREDAHMYQAELIAKRVRKDDGSYDIETKGIWKS